MTVKDRLFELFKNTNYKPFEQCNIEANLANQFTEYALNHIIDEFLDSGIIKLPINAGDMIYRPFGGIVESWIVTTIVLYPEEIVFIDDSENSFKESDIGVSVFITKEEAEQALRTPQNDEVRE